MTFADNSPELIQAYVDSKEGMLHVPRLYYQSCWYSQSILSVIGIDKAGGFAIQGLGGHLIAGINGSFDNCVGFPAQAFFAWLAELAEEGELLELDA